MTVSPSSKLPNLSVVLGTLNLSVVSQARWSWGPRNSALSHAPYSEKFLLETFPHRNLTPSWFSWFRSSYQLFSVPTFKVGTNIFFFSLSTCCKAPTRGNTESSWDLGGQRNVLIQQLTCRYIKCQEELSSTCFDCAPLINRTRNREIRTPSRKAVRLQKTDQHTIVLSDIPLVDADYK